MAKTTSAVDWRVKKVLVPAAKIEKASVDTAQWIDKQHKGKKLILLGLLKGCVPFFAKVMIRVKTPCQIDFIRVASFAGGTKALSSPKVLDVLAVDVKGKHVVIIEDVVDSGKTVAKVAALLMKRGALGVKVVSLLNKPEGRKIDFEPDLSCFTIPNEFVVGFGLDYEEKYRNLGYIGVLDERAYNSRDRK